MPRAFVVSPSKPLAKIAIGIAESLILGTPVERMRLKAKVDNGFMLRRHDGRRVAVQAVAASKGGANVRGVDVVILVLDESEFFASGESGDFAITDKDQIAAATPRLLGHVLAISTPWPSENLTGELFDRNFGHPVDAVVAAGTSMFMRPSAKLAAAIERERQRDPENASREYDVEPGSRGGQKLFDLESIAACIDEDRPVAIDTPAGLAVGAGGDLGLERDSSAIAIVSNESGLFVLREFDEVRPTKLAALAPGYVIKDRFAPVMKRHGATELTADAHYRQSAVEHLEAVGLTFVDAPTGQQGKYDSYMFLRTLLRTRKIRLPNSPRLLAQLRAVTQTPLPGGGTRISSPRRAGGGHGDVLSAVVAACWAIREERAPMGHGDERDARARRKHRRRARPQSACAAVRAG